MKTATHPSFLELDRLHLGGGTGEVANHVAHCADCAGHVSRLATPVAVPGEILRLQRPPAETWWVGKRWRLALTVSCAAVALIVPATVSRLSADASVGAKAGSPGVALFIKRGERVSLWDGRAPIYAGDLLRLEVAPEGFGHVRVSTPSPSGAPTLLYDGEVSSQGSWLLPLSFQVDGSGSSETIDVVLSEGREASTTWSTRISLEKRSSHGDTP